MIFSKTNDADNSICKKKKKKTNYKLVKKSKSNNSK